VEASLVGHDLTRGLSHFIKRPERRADESATDNGPDVTAENAADSAASPVEQAASGSEPSGDHLAA